MDYFRLSQDRRYLHVPMIANLSDILQRRADTSYENASKIADINVGFAGPDSQMNFIDVLDEQIYLVSSEIKAVFMMYEPAMQFKDICILDNATGDYRSYHIPIFQELDCLSEKSIISPDKTYIKKLVLTEKIPEEIAIFKIGGLNTDVAVIRLDVAESLLRRKIYKIRIKRLDLDKE